MQHTGSDELEEGEIEDFELLLSLQQKTESSKKQMVNQVNVNVKSSGLQGIQENINLSRYPVSSTKTGITLHSDPFILSNYSNGNYPFIASDGTYVSSSIPMFIPKLSLYKDFPSHQRITSQDVAIIHSRQKDHNASQDDRPICTLESLLSTNQSFIPVNTQSQESTESIPFSALSILSTETHHIDVNDRKRSFYLIDDEDMEATRREKRSRKRHEHVVKRKPSKINETLEDQEFSSLGSDSMEDIESPATKQKHHLYRRVSHLWRKRERRLLEAPQEEGQISIDTAKQIFYKQNGINLQELSEEDTQFIDDLNKRHHDRWNRFVGKVEITSEYLNDLKTQMMLIMNKNKKPDPVKSPWIKAEQIRQIQKEIKGNQRRTVIPYQPSPSTIVHSYYPSNVFLRYQFTIPLSGNVKQQDEFRKSITPIYTAEGVHGYKQIQIGSTELPSAIKREYENAWNAEENVKQQIQKAKEELDVLVTKIKEKEKQLETDRVDLVDTFYYRTVTLF